jgi:cytochrome c2
MSEFSGSKEEDFEPLMESYKEEFKSGCGGNKGTLPNESDKLDKFLKTPKMKKLHKEAMKFQGGDKVIKMVKDLGES